MLLIIWDIFRQTKIAQTKNCRLKSRITFLKACHYLYHPLFKLANKKLWKVVSSDPQNKLTHRALVFRRDWSQTCWQWSDNRSSTAGWTWRRWQGRGTWPPGPLSRKPSVSSPWHTGSLADDCSTVCQFPEGVPTIHTDHNPPWPSPVWTGWSRSAGARSQTPRPWKMSRCRPRYWPRPQAPPASWGPWSGAWGGPGPDDSWRSRCFRYSELSEMRVWPATEKWAGDMA